MDYFEPVEESYGRDEEGPEPADSEGSVSVPQLSFQLVPAALQQLHMKILILLASQIIMPLDSMRMCFILFKLNIFIKHNL